MPAKKDVFVTPYPYLAAEGMLTKLALQQLKNPFDPEEITWKPTGVKSNKCTALAYADKRAYEDRLNEVFGEGNWMPTFTHVVSTPYKVFKKAKRKVWNDPNSEIIEPEQIIEGHRVMVVVRISINGLGHKESSGVSESEDENSITTAEAQAFKRACSQWHIGRYLYRLPRYEDVEYAYGKIKFPPKLPEWALPVKYCADCVLQIRTTEFKLADNTIKSWDPVEITKRSQAHFEKDLCMDCMRKRKTEATTKEVDTRLTKGPQSEPAPAQEVAAA